MKIINNKYGVLFALLAAFPTSVFAAKEGDSADVVVKGSISVQPDCYLNGNKSLAYEYGPVVISDVENKKVFRTNDIQVSCDSTPTAQLQLTFKSDSVVAGQGNIIKVADTGMGIAMLNAGNGDSEVMLNKPFNVTATTLFQLKGLLVNLKPGTVLKTGKFSTAITIEASYE